MKLPKIIPFAQHEVGFVVEFRANFSQSAVTAAALEAVFVPESFHRFEEEPFCDDFSTLRAQPRAAGVARHATAKSVFVLILLTYNKQSNLNGIHY